MTHSRPHSPWYRLVPALALVVAAQCRSSMEAPATTLAGGTWGGEGAGLIVGDTTAHLHIGCTKGDFARPASLDGGGHFDIAGSYVLRAYPVEIGPTLPAHFRGTVRGTQLVISVVVDDTVSQTSVTLGPATVLKGREPRLGPCPICVKPAASR